jgi:ketosteroid isomerase-like protein
MKIQEDGYMGERDDLRVVHLVYDAFGRGDVGGVIPRLADGVTWTTPGPPNTIPYAGQGRGHDEVAGHFEAFGASTETTAFEPQKFFADGDMVVVLGHYTFSVRSTGKVVDNDFVRTFRLADGKISAFGGYGDSAAVVAAFTAGSDQV